MNQHDFDLAAHVFLSELLGLQENVDICDMLSANDKLHLMYVTAAFTEQPLMVVAKAFAAIEQTIGYEPTLLEIFSGIVSRPDPNKKAKLKFFIGGAALRYESR